MKVYSGVGAIIRRVQNLHVANAANERTGGAACQRPRYLTAQARREGAVSGGKWVRNRQV